MDFVQRRGNNSPTQPARGGVGEGVAAILAAYGVEPAKLGTGPEVEDDEEDKTFPPRGSSGIGGTSSYKYRASFRGGVEDRDALINKYPMLRDGTGR